LITQEKSTLQTGLAGKDEVERGWRLVPITVGSMCAGVNFVRA